MDGNGRLHYQFCHRTLHQWPHYLVLHLKPIPRILSNIKPRTIWVVLQPWYVSSNCHHRNLELPRPQNSSRQASSRTWKWQYSCPPPRRMVPTPHTTKLGITVSGKQMLHEQSSPYTVLFFIRHGQVENPQKVIYERLPGFHLSEKGQQQVLVEIWGNWNPHTLPVGM